MSMDLGLVAVQTTTTTTTTTTTVMIYNIVLITEQSKIGFFC